MIIGRFLGNSLLGLYSLAYKIVDFPVNNLAFVASRALFPVMSRQQAVPEEMATLYLRTLGMIAFVSAPMMTGLLILREPFIAAVLGNKWLAMGDVLLWLAAVGFVNSLTCTTGSVLMARGRTDYLFYLGIVGVALQFRRSSSVSGGAWRVSRRAIWSRRSSPRSSPSTWCCGSWDRARRSFCVPSASRWLSRQRWCSRSWAASRWPHRANFRGGRARRAGARRGGDSRCHSVRVRAPVLARSLPFLPAGLMARGLRSRTRPDTATRG